MCRIHYLITPEVSPMIRRPLTIGATALAVTLLATPSAMATTRASGASTDATAATACTGALAASISPTAVTITGTARCAADTDLTLRTSAHVGALTVNATTAVHATANTTVSINASLPVAGCTAASAALVDTRTGVTVAATVANRHQPAEDDSMLDHALVVGVPLLGAGLLAALTLTALRRRRRRRQEQHRPVGRRIPEPVKPKVETDLRVAAQPLAVDRLDPVEAGRRHPVRDVGADQRDRPGDQDAAV